MADPSPPPGFTLDGPHSPPPGFAPDRPSAPPPGFKPDAPIIAAQPGESPKSAFVRQLKAHLDSASPQDRLNELYQNEVYAPAERGFMEGVRDIIETLAPPEYPQPLPGHTIPPNYYKEASEFIGRHEPNVTPAPDAVGRFTQGAFGVAGGVAPGALEYTMGVPFAALHGVKTAEEHAQEKGRHATPGEMAWDAFVEGLGRRLMGSVASRNMGRLSTGLSFGAITGGEDIAEHRDAHDAAHDAALNALIGFLAPGMTAKDRAAVETARDMAKSGDYKGAMAHLNPVLLKYSSTIAAAARNLGIDAGVEPQPPPETRIGGHEPEPTFTTNPAKIAQEQALEVARLEREGTEAAYRKAQPKPETKEEAAAPAAAFDRATSRVADEDLARAREHLRIARSPKPRPATLYDTIKRMGGIRSTTKEGKPIPELSKLMAVFKDHKPYQKLLTKKGGLTPDYLREALAQEGWFGGRPEDDTARTDLNDLYDLMARDIGEGVHHPEDEQVEALYYRRMLEREMGDAGIAPADNFDTAASKLALYRARQVRDAAAREAGEIGRELQGAVPEEVWQQLLGGGYEPGADIGAEYEEYPGVEEDARAPRFAAPGTPGAETGARPAQGRGGLESPGSIFGPRLTEGTQANLQEDFERFRPSYQAIGGRTPFNLNATLSHWLRERGTHTGVETLGAYNAGTGAVTHVFTSSLPDRVLWEEGDAFEQALSDPSQSIVVHHNHPSSRSLSAGDLSNLARPGLKWIVAHGHDGSFYAARLGPKGRGLTVAQIRWLADSIGNRAVDQVMREIVQGRIDRDVAGLAHTHFVNEALAEQGFIDYIHSKEFSADVTRLFRSATGVVPHRPAAAVRPAEGLSRILEELGAPPGQPAEAQRAGGGPSEPGAGAPGAGRKPEQLRLLEDGDPYKTDAQGKLLSPAELDRRRVADASLATRITHREKADSIARARMAGWEDKFKGISDADRIGLITAYQRGGVANVPEQWREFFKGFEDILAKQYSAERAAGIDYEERVNYAPGYWKDEEQAARYYAAHPSAKDAPFRKPSFTKAKAFDDYLEGIEAGFVPKVTNPAVIAAMRIEAGNAAISRILAMRDFVEDGNAIPAEETTKEARDAAREKRKEITQQEVLGMASRGELWDIKDLNANRREQGLPPVRGNFRYGGVEYEVVPEALARLRAKQKRMTAQSMALPAEYRSWMPMDVGGKRYYVEPSSAQLLRRALGSDKQLFTELVGVDRYSKVAQTERLLTRAWMGIRNATIPTKLALSAFHPIHVLTIDTVQPIAAALTQGLNRRMSAGDFIKAVMDTRAKGRERYGRYVSDNWAKPDKELSPIERLEQNLLLAGGMAPQRPSIYEIRAGQELRRTLNDLIPTMKQEGDAKGWTWGRRFGLGSEYAKTVFLNIGHIVEKLQGPLFNDWIPSLKTAAYLNEAKLLLTSRPELLEPTPRANAQLRMELRKISKSIDNRYGEMQYDKLFWNSLIKRGMFAAFLSVGWNAGFIREFGGGLLADLPQAAINAVRGKEAELTARAVYASTYIFFASVLGGLMTYLFTGQPPKEPKDYVYPRMPDGSRLNTPMFTRVFGETYYHMQQEGLIEGTESLVENKLAPSTQTFVEVLNNQDYFGNQIYDPNAPLWDQVAEASGHFGFGTLAPISVESLMETQPTTDPARVALSFGGFNPAPRYIEETTTQSRILRAFREQHPGRTIPYAEIDRVNELRTVKQAYKQWVKTGQPADEAAFNQAWNNYATKYRSRLKPHTLAGLKRAWNKPDFAAEFDELDRATQAAILKGMTPDERKEYLRYAHKDIRHQFEGVSP